MSEGQDVPAAGPGASALTASPSGKKVIKLSAEDVAKLKVLQAQARQAKHELDELRAYVTSAEGTLAQSASLLKQALSTGSAPEPAAAQPPTNNSAPQ